MTPTFADTSGLFALVVESDHNHTRARAAFDRYAALDSALLTTSYVLVETYALLGRRVGLEAVRTFRERFAPLLEVVWIDAPLHDRGLDLLLERDRRDLSLVDTTSFVVMRDEDLDDAFAFDTDVEKEGFGIVGDPPATAGGAESEEQ